MTMPDPSRMNILLVDDQSDGLLALEAVLSDLGQNLIKARSGREALRCVLADDFAVILLDVQMPEMSGYEVASLIREKERCRHTPIIFLTASHTADEQRMQGYAAGAVDYMFKPLEGSILRSKVNVFVDLARKTELVRLQADELRRSEHAARELAAARASLIVDLEAANQRLAAVNGELEAFSYSVSHDLRAPLRSIDGFSQALVEDCGSELGTKGHEHLRRVRMATARMSELIDDLIQLSRVGRADLRRAKVDLTQIAETIVADLQRTEQARQVTFVIEKKLIVEADPRLMRVLLENLLGNAWKFTAHAADARVELCAMSRGDETAYSVRDNGAGFDMSQVERLFAPFQRLHSQQEFAGTGIGLATVRRIVERHGGRVWAEGELKRGASISFTIPAADAS
jgi:two-component system, sensor histidine kinase and response regulator